MLIWQPTSCRGRSHWCSVCGSVASQQEDSGFLCAYVNAVMDWWPVQGPEGPSLHDTTSPHPHSCIHWKHFCCVLCIVYLHVFTCSCMTFQRHYILDGEMMTVFNKWTGCSCNIWAPVLFVTVAGEKAQRAEVSKNKKPPYIQSVGSLYTWWYAYMYYVLLQGYCIHFHHIYPINWGLSVSCVPLCVRLVWWRMCLQSPYSICSDVGLLCNGHLL